MGRPVFRRCRTYSLWGPGPRRKHPAEDLFQEAYKGLQKRGPADVGNENRLPTSGGPKSLVWPKHGQGICCMHVNIISYSLKYTSPPHPKGWSGGVGWGPLGWGVGVFEGITHYICVHATDSLTRLWPNRSLGPPRPLGSNRMLPKIVTGKPRAKL